MYDKKLKLREVEPETIYISKAERYELIALVARSLEETMALNMPDEKEQTVTH